jgi:AcrR family transcriptional regulator
MGLTKPALYRYFRSKEELNQAIEERVREEYCRLGRRFLEQSAGLTLEQAFRLYIQTHFRYFGENPDCFYFFVLSALKEPFLAHADIRQNHAEVIHRFAGLIEETKVGWKAEEAEKILRYVFTTGTVWLHTFLHFRDIEKGKDPHSLTAEQKSTLIEAASEAALRGFGEADLQDDLCFERIERECRVRPEEMPEQNRIFESISEVVAEEGLAKSSLEKIARKAGMTKSSLYFYFRNKDDMLGSMFNREREQFDTIFASRARLYKRIDEKIYCHILVAASYNINNTTLRTAFSWFHYQGIIANLESPLRHTLGASASFLEEALDSGRLKSHGLEPFHILFYMHSLVLNEILGSKRRNPPVTLTLKDMRAVYRYFTRGALRSTK